MYFVLTGKIQTDINKLLWSWNLICVKIINKNINIYKQYIIIRIAILIITTIIIIIMTLIIPILIKKLSLQFLSCISFFFCN